MWPVSKFIVTMTDKVVALTADRQGLWPASLTTTAAARREHAAGRPAGAYAAAERLADICTNRPTGPWVRETSAAGRMTHKLTRRACGAPPQSPPASPWRVAGP